VDGSRRTQLTPSVSFIDRFHPVLHVQLTVDIMNMLTHGIGADSELIRDFLIEQTF
jgi:hypothetical protein